MTSELSSVDLFANLGETSALVISFTSGLTPVSLFSFAFLLSEHMLLFLVG